MKPELSSYFDSDLAHLEPEDFDYVVQESIECFTAQEFDTLCLEIEAWDRESLGSIRGELERLLTLRSTGGMRYSVNLLLDHCMGGEGLSLFKTLFALKAVEWSLVQRDSRFSPPFEGEPEGFGTNGQGG